MRTRKAVLNLVTSLLRNFTGLVLGMVATPIVLSYLGEEKFGILRVLMDWFGHLTLVEFGLYAAVMSFMAKVLGEKKGHVGSALRMIFAKYGNVLLMQIAVIALFSVFFEKLVPVGPDYQRETWVSFFILGSSVFFIFSQIFKAQLEASQRGYLVSYVMMFQNIFYVAASILFLVQGWSLIGQAVAYSLSIGLAFAAYLWLCRDQLVHLAQPKENFEDAEVFTKQRANLFVSELCARASLMSDNLMITFVLGTKEVTAFFITQRLIQVMQGQLQNVSGAAWPALGELYYQKQMETFRSRILQLTELVAFLSGVSLSVIVLFNPAFIVLWTGESTFAGEWVSNLAAINAGFFALMTLWSWCFSATGKTELITKVFISQALVNISLSYILTHKIGVVGPLVATLVGYISVAIWWISLVLCRTFSLPLLKFHRMWMVPFILPIAAVIGGMEFWGYPVVGSWWRLAILGLLATMAISGFCYSFFLSAPTKVFLVERIKNSSFKKKYF